MVPFHVPSADSPVLKLLLRDVYSCNPLNDGDAVVPTDNLLY